MKEVQNRDVSRTSRSYINTLIIPCWRKHSWRYRWAKSTASNFGGSLWKWVCRDKLSTITGIPLLPLGGTGITNTKSIDITSHFFIGGVKGRISPPRGCRNALAHWHASQDFTQLSASFLSFGQKYERGIDESVLANPL
jgi:hypothetical protein